MNPSEISVRSKKKCPVLHSGFTNRETSLSCSISAYLWIHVSFLTHWSADVPISYTLFWLTQCPYLHYPSLYTSLCDHPPVILWNCNFFQMKISYYFQENILIPGSFQNCKFCPASSSGKCRGSRNGEVLPIFI